VGVLGQTQFGTPFFCNFIHLYVLAHTPAETKEEFEGAAEKPQSTPRRLQTTNKR